MKENIILNKSLDFGCRILKLSQFLAKGDQRIIADQILRCGMSIGANVSESAYAASNADFINKLYIAQKEASETEFWLNALHKTNIINDKMHESLHGDVVELLKLLGSSIITAKKKKTT